MQDNPFLHSQYELLGHESLGYTEFRVLNLQNSGSEVIERAWANDQISFVTTALRLIDRYPQGHIFVGLNPRRDSKLPSSVGNIDWLNILMIDIDPIRPKGVPSTDESHREAIKIGEQIVLDIPNSILVDSGSGSHVYVPISPIHVDDINILTESCKEWSDAIKKKYQKEGFRIDSVYDLPRITRVWGTYNAKSGRIVQPITAISNGTFPRLDLSLDQIRKKSILNQTEIEKSLVSPSDERFIQLCKLHPGISKMMREEGNFESPSEANYAFVAYLTKAHFSLMDIKKYAKLNPLVQNTLKSPNQFEKDVERIVTKIRKERSLNLSLTYNNDSYIDDLSQRKPGISTGFSRLDNMISGLKPGYIYVLAARTNQGKTSFACNLSYNLISQNHSVLFFPTELGYTPLFDKLLAQATNISLKQFQIGEFNADEKEKITAQLGIFKQYPFIVREDYNLTLEKIDTAIREVAPSFVIVDYIQAMAYENGGEPREIEAVIRGLNSFAKQNNVPILVCSQLNRAALNSEISLQHLKGSGAIEEAADVVMAISTLTPFEYPKEVDLHILKAKYGEVGKDRFLFYSSTGTFKEKV